MAGTTLHGDYFCNRCRLDFVVANDIGGNVKVKGSPQGVIVVDNFIDGNFEAWSNVGPFLVVADPFEPEARGEQRIGGHAIIRNNTFVESGDPGLDEFSPVFGLNQVGRNVVAKGNTGERLNIAANHIGGVLNCAANSHAPDLDGGQFGDNVAKRLRGQCRHTK